MFTSELDLMIFVAWDELRAIRSEVEDLDFSPYRILNSSKNYFSKDEHFRKFMRFLKILISFPLFTTYLFKLYFKEFMNLQLDTTRSTNILTNLRLP